MSASMVLKNFLLLHVTNDCSHVASVSDRVHAQNGAACRVHSPSVATIRNNQNTYIIYKDNYPKVRP